MPVTGLKDGREQRSFEVQLQPGVAGDGPFQPASLELHLRCRPQRLLKTSVSLDANVFLPRSLPLSGSGSALAAAGAAS